MINCSQPPSGRCRIRTHLFCRLLVLMLAICPQLRAQGVGDYRSTGDVNLNQPANWQVWNGASWTAATVAPNGNIGAGDTVTILAGHLWNNPGPSPVIPAGAVLIHYGTLPSGGANFSTAAANKVQINGTYIHQTTASASVLLNGCVLGNQSLFVYRGSSSFTPSSSFANRSYYNLLLESVSGALTMNFGSAAGSGSALTVNGHLRVGPNVSLQQGSFAGSLHFNGDITIEGVLQCNSFTLAAGKTFTDARISGACLIAATAGQNFFFNGIYRTANVNGLSGSASTSVSSGSGSSVALGAGSEIVYASALLQKVTGRADYAKLTLSNGEKQLGADAQVGGALAINNACLSLGNNSLALHGDIQLNAGTFSGTDSSKLLIDGSTVLSGPLLFRTANARLHSLIIDGPSVAIGTDSLQLLNQLQVKHGVLDLQHRPFVLRSTPVGTACVAASYGVLVNDERLVVERTLPVPASGLSSGRAWRMLCAPVWKSDSNSVFDQWQNHGQVNGGGIEIWGPSGSGISFGTNYSLRSYNALSNSFEPVSNTLGTVLSDTSSNRPFLVFVSGSYGAPTVTAGSAGTVLRSQGHLYTGRQQRLFTAAPGRRFNLIANPYACAVDFDSVWTRSINLERQFWTVDPALNANGGYVLVKWNDAAQAYESIPASSVQNRFIQAGQAFFVRSIDTGNVAVVFEESMKAPSEHNLHVFRLQRSMNDNRIDVVLEARATDSAYVPVDQAVIRFGLDSAEAAAPKMTNPGESLFIQKGSRWSVVAKPVPSPGDTVALSLTKAARTQYRLCLEETGSAGSPLMPVLHDRYTGAAFTVKDRLCYPFCIAADSGSVPVSRFYLTWEPFATSAADGTAPLPPRLQIGPNPAPCGAAVALGWAGTGPGSLEVYNESGQRVARSAVQNRQPAEILSRLRPGRYTLVVRPAPDQNPLTAVLIIY